MLRLGVLAAAVTLSLASSGSNRSSRGTQGPPPAMGGNAPVKSQPMAQSAALGLWKSSFGAVKVEADPSRPGNVRGVWLYDRNGQEVIGYFAGGLSGNTLSFSWEEPTTSGPPLQGGGYLVFDPRGKTFQGKWWTTNRDRGGDWSGWRLEGANPNTGPAEQAPDQPPPDPNADPNAPPPANPPPLPGTESPSGDFIEDKNAIDPQEAVTEQSLTDQTLKVLSTLAPREARVLKMRFGIGERSNHTLEEVGQDFEVTRERIRQIEAKALRKLRHPSRSRTLRSFVEN